MRGVCTAINLLQTAASVTEPAHLLLVLAQVCGVIDWGHRGFGSPAAGSGCMCCSERRTVTSSAFRRRMQCLALVQGFDSGSKRGHDSTQCTDITVRGRCYGQVWTPPPPPKSLSPWCSVTRRYSPEPRSPHLQPKPREVREQHNGPVGHSMASHTRKELRRQ